MIEILIYVVPTVILLGLGIFVGGWAERRHFRSIIEREASTANMVSTQSKIVHSATGVQATPDSV